MEMDRYNAFRSDYKFLCWNIVGIQVDTGTCYKILVERSKAFEPSYMLYL